MWVSLSSPSLHGVVPIGREKKALGLASLYTRLWQDWELRLTKSRGDLWDWHPRLWECLCWGGGCNGNLVPTETMQRLLSGGPFPQISQGPAEFRSAQEYLIHQASVCFSQQPPQYVKSSLSLA